MKHPAHRDFTAERLDAERKQREAEEQSTSLVSDGTRLPVDHQHPSKGVEAGHWTVDNLDTPSLDGQPIPALTVVHSPAVTSASNTATSSGTPSHPNELK